MPLVRGLNKMGGSPLKIISLNNLNKLAVARTRGFFLAVLCGFLPPLPFPSLGRSHPCTAAATALGHWSLTASVVSPLLGGLAWGVSSWLPPGWQGPWAALLRCGCGQGGGRPRMIALAAERVRCGLGWLVWPWQPGCVLSVSLRLPAAEEEE